MPRPEANGLAHSGTPEKQKLAVSRLPNLSNQKAASTNVPACSPQGRGINGYWLRQGILAVFSIVALQIRNKMQSDRFALCVSCERILLFIEATQTEQWPI